MRLVEAIGQFVIRFKGNATFPIVIEYRKELYFILNSTIKKIRFGMIFQ